MNRIDNPELNRTMMIIKFIKNSPSFRTIGKVINDCEGRTFKNVQNGFEIIFYNILITYIHTYYLNIKFKS